MLNITIFVDKTALYEDVKKTTEYTAVKMTDDQSAYNRISATDYDKSLLDRFFNEAVSDITDILKPFILSIPSMGNLEGKRKISNLYEFSADLHFPSLFEDNLIGSINNIITSYFINYIVCQWYKFSNKKETQDFKILADNCIVDLRRKIYFRKSPTRKKPTF